MAPPEPVAVLSVREELLVTVTLPPALMAPPSCVGAASPDLAATLPVSTELLNVTSPGVVIAAPPVSETVLLMVVLDRTTVGVTAASPVSV